MFAPAIRNELQTEELTMAATASELRRIYSYLLGEHDHPERLPALQRALDVGRARRPRHARCDADRLLAIANGGVNPELTFTQLDCLRVVLSQQDFAPIVPTITDRRRGVDVAGRALQAPVLGAGSRDTCARCSGRCSNTTSWGRSPSGARCSTCCNELSPARRLERRARRRARRAAGPRHHLQAGLAVPGDR